MLRGIPDADAFPCVCMDYETVVSIGPPNPALTTGTWSVDINAFAHPVQPLSYVSRDSTGASRYGGALNPTLLEGATTYTPVSINFANLFTSYRMLYAGVTIDLDASALNNQGSVVAAQMPLASQRFNTSFVTVGGVTYIQPHLDSFAYRVNFPGQTISQMPGAYMGLAQDGIYMPIKLDPNADWVTTASMTFVLPANDQLANQYTYGSLHQQGLPTTSAFTGSGFPFYGPDYAGVGFEPAFCPIATGGTIGDLCIPFQQNNTGLMAFYNMAPGSRLTVKIKWGIEGRVFPTSVLAPAMQPSAMVDQLALEAYSDLAATLPWAYPSSYNSWDEIIGVLKQAWNTLKPVAATALASTGHPVGIAGGGLLSMLPDATVTKRQQFQRPSGASTVEAKQKRKQPQNPPKGKQNKNKKNKRNPFAELIRRMEAIEV